MHKERKPVRAVLVQSANDINNQGKRKNIHIGAHKQTNIRAHIQTHIRAHIGSHKQTHVGAHVQTHIGAHIQTHVGAHIQTHIDAKPIKDEFKIFTNNQKNIETQETSGNFGSKNFLTSRKFQKNPLCGLKSTENISVGMGRKNGKWF